jgi:hypothetical protein
MFRLARGLLDGTPRPPRNLRLARPQVEPVGPPYSPTLRQKSKHLMQPPTTSYPHGYSNNQHRSNTSVKSHFLLSIPEWAVKTCHCTRHTEHYSATDPLEGEYDEYRTPKFLGLVLIHSPSTHLDPALTWPRPTTGQQRGEACMP